MGESHGPMSRGWVMQGLAAAAQAANMPPRLASVLATCVVAAPLALWSAPVSAAVPTCFGQPATIVGTAGDDRLGSDPRVADVIWAGGGNDLIQGGWREDFRPEWPADLMCGGRGNDQVYAGPGDDRISGGDGDDHVDGGDGSDVVQGNGGNDFVRDESYEDADSGNDVLRGGGGDDRLTTAWGIDRAYGEAGNDTIVDWECDRSYLYGGSGDDTFESWRSSFEGWHGSYCGYPHQADVINGGEDYDTAQTSTLDRVTKVEDDVRVPLCPDNWCG